MAKCIRCDPLLPPPYQGIPFTKPVTDIEGLNLPLVHCGFEGCGWVSESLPCHRNALHEKWSERVHQGEWSTTPCRQKLTEEVYGCCGSASCLRHHIVAYHRDVISEMCGQAALRVESYDYYCEAVAWREQQKMSCVGISIDRRTFKHASVALK